MKRFLLLFIQGCAIFLIISCASAPYSQRDTSSRKVADLVNSSDNWVLSQITQTPFLFDGEIIGLEKDVNMIWTNIARAEFKFGNIFLIESLPASSGDYQIFADTMEVKTWFEKYLTENSSLVRIECESGTFFMILGEKKKVEISGKNQDYPAILAFTGPVSGGVK